MSTYSTVHVLPTYMYVRYSHLIIRKIESRFELQYLDCFPIQYLNVQYIQLNMLKC